MGKQNGKETQRGRGGRKIKENVRNNFIHSIEWRSPHEQKDGIKTREDLKKLSS